jgi:hypothetical protein
MKNKTNKIIMSVTSVALLGAGLVNAQAPNTSNSQNSFGQKMMQSLTDAQKKALEQAKSLFESGKQNEAKALLNANGIKPPFGGHGHGKGPGGMGDRKAIEDAIIAGNFANFQAVASTSPLKGLTVETFNKLTPQFQAKKNAEEQIRSILKAAGVAEPTRPGKIK